MNPPLDILQRLMIQEQECNELRQKNACEELNIHKPVWRQMVVEWCYQVIDHICADRELVYITMNILDRFLLLHQRRLVNSSEMHSRKYLTNKKDYETAVMTALLMTMKLQGLTSLCISDLVQMSSNSVTSMDIVQVGKEIIQSLTWNKQIPTAAKFAHTLVQLLPDTVSEKTAMKIFENAVFQIELSIQDESCSREPPSLVAWMAFDNSIRASSLALSIKSSVRSLITQEMGHVYNSGLLQKLQKFQMQSRVSSNMPTVVPPEDDDDYCHVMFREVFSLKARPLIDSRIVSLDNLTNTLHQVNKDDQASANGLDICATGLKRSKRARFC